MLVVRVREARSAPDFSKRSLILPALSLCPKPVFSLIKLLYLSIIVSLLV